MELTLPRNKTEKLAVAFLAATSLAAYGFFGTRLLGLGHSERTAGHESQSPASVAIRAPMTADAFKKQMAAYSKNNMIVVMLQRTHCVVCPDVASALEDVRYKVKFPFTVYQIDAEQNPEIAAYLHPRKPDEPVLLHLFYNGKKIHESQGISTNPAHLQDYLYMAQEMADGHVSALDPYTPPSP